jgi:6-phosphogluconolactonase
VRPVHGELVVVDDVPGEFAERVIEAFHSRPHDSFSLAVSGGELARRSYERLADDGGSQLDWWKVDVYWGDERCVPLDDEASNYRLARESLLERVGAVNANFPMRCDEGPDPYQLRLGELGRIDVVHLGVGPDGHVASLFPDSPALDMNEDPSGRNPFPRMTLTYAGIARARLVLVTVAGESKRDALARVAAGDPSVPATHVKADRVLWIVDPAAAGELA